MIFLKDDRTILKYKFYIVIIIYQINFTHSLSFDLTHTFVLDAIVNLVYISSRFIYSKMACLIDLLGNFDYFQNPVGY